MVAFEYEAIRSDEATTPSSFSVWTLRTALSRLALCAEVKPVSNEVIWETRSSRRRADVCCSC